MAVSELVTVIGAQRKAFLLETHQHHLFPLPPDHCQCQSSSAVLVSPPHSFDLLNHFASSALLTHHLRDMSAQYQKAIDNVEKFLHQPGKINDYGQKIENLTGVKRIYVAQGIASSISAIC